MPTKPKIHAPSEWFERTTRCGRIGALITERIDEVTCLKCDPLIEPPRPVRSSRPNRQRNGELTTEGTTGRGILLCRFCDKPLRDHYKISGCPI